LHEVERTIDEPSPMKRLDFSWFSALGLQAKLVLILIIPTVGLVTALLVWFGWSQSRAVYQQYVNEGSAIASMIEQQIQFNEGLPSLPIMQEMLSRTLEHRTEYVMLALYDVNGRLVTSISTNATIRAENPANQEIMKSLVTGVGNYLIEDGKDWSGSARQLEVHTPIRQGKRIVGALESYRPLGQIEALATRFIRGIVIIGPLAVGLLALILFAAVNRVVIHPIRRLSAATARVAEGRYDHELPISGSDELAALGRVFNRMARSINVSMMQEKALNTRLATLNTIMAELARSLDLDLLLDRLADGICQLVSADGVVVYLIDSQTHEIRLVHTHRMTVEEAGRVGNIRDKGLFGLSTRTMQSQLIEYAPDHPATAGTPAHQPSFGSLLTLPLATGDRLSGVVIAGRTVDTTPFRYADLGTVQSLVLFGATAVEKALLYEQSQELAVTDGLTGLFNHREFQRRLGNEIERNQRYGHPFSLLLIDIDYFKQINDQHGHLAGDVVLKVLAEAIQGGIRTIDIASRYGGEEFAVILPETGLAGALVVAEQIRGHVAGLRIPAPSGQPLSRTVSIGVATVPEDADRREQVIDAADKALYLAKFAGRDRVKSYREFMQTQLASPA
jgi:diguanylate cyclase (GGDEF)-like protein